ncbi:MAG: DUF58 domain-containing protein [Acidimicrobiales bacterium]
MAPLTRSGSTIGFLALASYLAGWLLGWNELMVCAAGCGLALLFAVGFVIGRHRVEVTRALSHDRVTVGEAATSTLTITNPGRTPVGPRRVEERSGERWTTIDITGLGPGATTSVDHLLDTRRRGIVDVGPAVIAKADPLGLMRREVEQAGVDQLWVQPRVVSLRPVPVGFAKDLEGPTSDTSPAGDVSFHAIREYSFGDDHRHVHWMSTARTGTLMVRHYVDNRRPQLTVLLDTDDVYDLMPTDDREGRSETTADTVDAAVEGDGFELAVEVAASLVVNTQLAQQPVSLVCSADDRTSEPPLDVLTTVAIDHAPLERRLRHTLAHAPATSVLVIVTGARPPASLLTIVEEAKRSAHVIVVRCCADADGLRLPGTTTFSVDRLESFQAAWNASL